ncbi:hypothetical protein LSAT2_016752 [Lamellibrachia satsuma]|nr:hypothetical protein LSAT2_016752 [Lamellibrachia satsuma]
MSQGTFVPRVAFLTTNRSNPNISGNGSNQQDSSGGGPSKPSTMARRSTISTTSTKKELGPVRDARLQQLERNRRKSVNTVTMRTTTTATSTMAPPPINSAPPMQCTTNAAVTFSVTSAANPDYQKQTQPGELTKLFLKSHKGVLSSGSHGRLSGVRLGPLSAPDSPLSTKSAATFGCDGVSHRSQQMSPSTNSESVVTDITRGSHGNEEEKLNPLKQHIPGLSMYPTQALTPRLSKPQQAPKSSGPWKSWHPSQSAQTQRFWANSRVGQLILGGHPVVSIRYEGSDPVRRKNRKALLNKRRSTSQSPKGKKSMRKNGSSGTDSETERRFKGRRRRMSSMVRPKVPRPTERPAQETRASDSTPALKVSPRPTTSAPVIGPVLDRKGASQSGSRHGRWKLERNRLKSTLDMMRAERLSNLRSYEEELARITEEYPLELPVPEFPEPEEDFLEEMYNIPNGKDCRGGYWIPL